LGFFGNFMLFPPIPHKGDCGMGGRCLVLGGKP
jgi:hypothetical protein